MDEHNLDTLDQALAEVDFQLTEGFAIFRCGKKVCERIYTRDYAKTYGKEAKERGPRSTDGTPFLDLFSSICR